MQYPENRTVVQHLFILDESRTMRFCKEEAVAAFNQTLSSIVSSADADAKDHRLTFLRFGGGGIVQHLYNTRVAFAKPLDTADYHPAGCAPLFDAVGLGIGLIQVASKRQICPVVKMVTIVSDGLDSGSTKYCRKTIAQMIGSLKEANWIFNYIGAHPRVREVCNSLAIDNYYICKVQRAERRPLSIMERMARRSLLDTLNNVRRIPSCHAA